MQSILLMILMRTVDVLVEHGLPLFFNFDKKHYVHTPNQPNLQMPKSGYHNSFWKIVFYGKKN